MIPAFQVSLNPLKEGAIKYVWQSHMKSKKTNIEVPNEQGIINVKPPSLPWLRPHIPRFLFVGPTKYDNRPCICTEHVDGVSTHSLCFYLDAARRSCSISP